MPPWTWDIVHLFKRCNGSQPSRVDPGWPQCCTGSEPFRPCAEGWYPCQVQIVNGLDKEAVNNRNQKIDKLDLAGAQEVNLVTLPAARLSSNRQLVTEMVVERIDKLRALPEMMISSLDIARLGSKESTVLVIEHGFEERLPARVAVPDIFRLASGNETEVGTVRFGEQELRGMGTGETLGGTELAVAVTVLPALGFGFSGEMLIARHVLETVDC